MKIAVVSFSTHDYKIGKYTKVINKKYCKKNGYDFYFYETIPDVLKERHPAWCKLYYLHVQMQNSKYDYITWIDADAFFCNNKLKIEDWIKKSSGKNIIISRDPGYTLTQYKNSNEKRVNSGVMIYKNCYENINLLKYMLYDPIFEPNYNFVRSFNKNIKITGWDQAAIRYCLVNNPYMKNNTYINLDTNLNNNTHNVKKYIKNNGFIIHLTNFMGKYKGKKILTIKKFYNLQK